MTGKMHCTSTTCVAGKARCVVELTKHSQSASGTRKVLSSCPLAPSRAPIPLNVLLTFVTLLHDFAYHLHTSIYVQRLRS
jgi:hypothetical protein